MTLLCRAADRVRQVRPRARTFTVLLMLLPALACAAPITMEESARIPSPDPSFAFPIGVAVDGDWIVATGTKELLDGGYGQSEYGAWLYRRQVDGRWTLVRRLLATTGGTDAFGRQDAFVDMHAGVAAIVTATGGNWVFERTGDTWTPAQHTIETNGYDVAVDSGTIVVSDGICSWQANAYRKAADGVWRRVRQTEADSEPPIDCEGEYQFDNVETSGSSIIVYSVNETGPSARLFEGPYGAPAVMTRLMGPDGRPARWPFAVGPNTTIAQTGTRWLHAFSRETGSWQPSHALTMPELLNWNSLASMEMLGSILVIGRPDDPLRGSFAGSLAVYERDTTGHFRYVARLHTSEQTAESFVGLAAQVSGRRVVSGSIRQRAVYVYDLPMTLSTPATRQFDFASGSWTDLSATPGSEFTVTNSMGSNVLRQTNTTSNAAATVNGMDWTNQAIEAEIRPTAYASGTGSRWFGLVARYRDAQNYYYVTLRNSNEIQLREIVNGTFSTLATAALPVALNRTYRVRLEAIGKRLRVFVGDALVLEAVDPTHARGRAGIYMYRVAAEFDNIVVTPNPRTTLVTYSFYDDIDSNENWEQLGDWEWTRDPPPGGNGIYRQYSTTGGARAIVDPSIGTDDHIVRSRIKRTGGAGTNYWVGLAARYRDPNNYYYVTLRNNNVAALRKLVNGTIVELDTAPLATADGTWYDVRLSAIGQQLRVYVDDRLLLEARDTTHASGRYGTVMYKASADIDDFLVTWP